MANLTYENTPFTFVDPMRVNLSRREISDNNIHQNGKTVFKWAVTTLIKKIQDLVLVNDMTLDDINFFIPHSANIRILEAVCKGLDIPIEKCIESIRNYGNTSTASIPIAWYNGIIS